jgi:hypothetical protein
MNKKENKMSNPKPGKRPNNYDKKFWKEIEKYPETKKKFIESGHNWEALDSPDREICIGIHNKSMKD